MFEDKLLLWKFKNGSTDALEKIYQKYESYLFTVAVALLHNSHDAEDVLSDFFVLFVESAEKVKLSGNLKAYMAVCVANLARNRIKRRAIEQKVFANYFSDEPQCFEPDLAVIQKEETLIINQALSQLPYEQKEVVVLHLTCGLKFTQIAEATKNSVNTIRSRYRYGLSKLQSLLDGEVKK